MSTSPPPGSAADRAFGHPRGLLGRAGGLLMAHANAAVERRLVALARLEPDETVLVVGPGPGVGLDAASKLAGTVIGIEPSAEMRALCRERCGNRVELRAASVSGTGCAEGSVDVVLSVNNVQLWDDRAAGFAELHRVLRPGGRLLLSVHEKWLPVPRHELAAEATRAGFTDLQTWTWQPPGFAPLAAQLRVRRYCADRY